MATVLPGIAAAGPPLGPIIIPAVTGLAGVALGRFWDLFGEKKRWRREQCGKAYAEFCGSADCFFVEMTVDDDRLAWQRVHAAYVEMTQAGAMLDVFGSPEVADAAHMLWNWATEFMGDWDAFVMISADDWLPRSTEWRALMLAFTNAVREHLGDKKKLTITASMAGHA